MGIRFRVYKNIKDIKKIYWFKNMKRKLKNLNFQMFNLMFIKRNFTLIS